MRRLSALTLIGFLTVSTAALAQMIPFAFWAGNAAPEANCPSQAAAWTQYATCQATAPALTSGSTTTLVDSSAPDTGSASAKCSTGSLAVSGTCGTPPPDANCPAQSVAWSQYATCYGSASALSSGSSMSVSDTTGPDTGSATVSCSNGSLSVSGTCGTPPPGPCFPQGVYWSSACLTCTAYTSVMGGGTSTTVSALETDRTGSANAYCANNSVTVSSNSCQYTCAYNYVTGSSSCPAGYSGYYTWYSQLICDGSNCGAGSWQSGVLANYCTPICTPQYNVSTTSCPAPYSGTYTYYTLLTCDGSNGGNGSWSSGLVSNNCY